MTTTVTGTGWIKDRGQRDYVYADVMVSLPAERIAGIAAGQ